MKFLFLSLLLLTGTLSAQQIFEKDEVDRPARPTGGQPMLIDFIQHNIKTPFANKVNNISGRVEIKGVVETDGATSSLEVVSGLNEASNEEVLRIFRLFRAWDPALKGGVPVRQSFNYAIQFGEEPIENFNKATGELDFYFDERFQKLSTVDNASYRVRVEVDQNGIPARGFTFTSKSKKKWSESLRLENDTTPLPNDVVAYLLGVDKSALPHYLGNSVAFISKVATEPFSTDMPEYIITQDRKVVRELLPGVYSKVFYASGQVAKARVFESVSVAQNLGWYPNSKLKEKYYSELGEGGLEIDKIVALYDSNGTALLLNGNGELLQQGFKWGTGKIENGFLTGVWKVASRKKGVMAEETYDKGRFVEGRLLDGDQVVLYSKIEQLPEYKGGIQNFYKLLGQNIRYPSVAARNKVQGKVVLTFLVETDGSISGLNVDKGVEKSLDEEAKRVLKLSSGNWTPAKHRGVPVRVKYTVPVNFQLQ